MRFLLIPLLFCLTLPAFAADDEPVLNGEQKDYVSAVLPYRFGFVRERILAQFDSEDRTFYDDYTSTIYQLPGTAKNYKELTPKQAARFLAFPLVRPMKFYVFLAAYPNMQSLLRNKEQLALDGLDNPALMRYADLPDSARSQDIYLWSPDSPYWYSEYSYNDKAIPFRSYFIVHLTAVDAGHTNVEIIEHNPTVSMGRRLSVDARGAVSRFDIREVEPTTQDREFLLSCVTQFLDRGVPGRHFFNCRDPKAPPPEPVEPMVPFTTQ